MTLEFSFITNNNGPAIGAVRYDTLEGRDHIVAPMVMITEGVHAGSNGPLLYEPEQMKNSVPLWNHKPAVVYHPEENGRHVTACSPAQINARKVGIILNTRVDVGNVGGQKIHRMPAECWMDVKRLEAIDPRILVALEASTPMEVSTGLFHVPVESEGVFNGKPYKYKATQFAPDHLALLPDKAGACGLKDGAGLLLNHAGTSAAIKQHGIMPFMLQAMQQAWAAYATNAKSYGAITEELSTLLRAKLTSTDCWVVAVYDTFVVYECDGGTWKLPYVVEGDVVSVPTDAKPEQVARVVEYRTLDGKFVGNTQKDDTMLRAQAITAFLANSAGVWAEADRPVLEKMTDAQFTKLTSNTAAPEAPAAPAAPAAVVPPETPPAPAAPVANAAPQTVEAALAGMPAQIRSVMVNGLHALQREQTELIAKITANAVGVYTTEELKGMEVPALQKLAAAVTANVAQAAPESQFGGLFGYANNGVAVGNAGNMTANGADVPVLTRSVW